MLSLHWRICYRQATPNRLKKCNYLPNRRLSQSALVFNHTLIRTQLYCLQYFPPYSIRNVQHLQILNNKVYIIFILWVMQWTFMQNKIVSYWSRYKYLTVSVTFVTPFILMNYYLVCVLSVCGHAEVVYESRSCYLQDRY